MTRCAITCSEHGCNKIIHYDSTDTEVPLYCPTHRTTEGRHSAVRDLTKPPYGKAKVVEEEKMVEYACTNKKCGGRKIISYSDHMKGLLVLCDKCKKRKMVYRKDV
jgi:hypothetical protein